MQTMKKSKRLQPVRQIVENKANDAAKAMVEARQTRDAHQAKLKSLIEYKQDYLVQFQERAKGGISAAQLHHYQSFIAQLEMAISQQEEVVKQAGQTLDQRQHHWRNKHNHKKAMDKVVTRYQKAEQKQADKREQAQLDEHNTQAHQRKKSSD